MAGADEPATLSGFCQPMAMAMVSVFCDVNPRSRVSRRVSELAVGGGGELGGPGMMGSFGGGSLGNGFGCDDWAEERLERKRGGQD